MGRSRRQGVAGAALRHPLLFATKSVRRRPAPHPDVAPPAGCQEALERVAAMPVHTWTYGWEHPSVKHMGPMAQDFAATFGLGSFTDRIEHVDASGVLFAAVKALHTKVAELESRVAELEGERPSDPGSLHRSSTSR